MITSHYFGKGTATLVMLVITAMCASGQKQGAGFLIPEFTLSPDHRYGVTVPIFDLESDRVDYSKNKLVEMRSGRVLAVIHADTGYDRRLNFREVLPARWSPHGSLLLWEVAGKWNPNALVLLKIEKGKAKWQVDLLTTVQQAILGRTRKTAQKEYLAAKKWNAGSGSAFPDGFTIDVSASYKGAKTVSFPLSVHADLSANPKQIEDCPANLEAQLDGVVNQSGRFTVTKFNLLRRNP